MTLLATLFGKSKKKSLKAKCPITKENIEEGFGYMLSTSEVISSKKYWDMIMTEPETMAYTLSHFKQEASGTQMRGLIFEKYSSVTTPWMVSDSCINLFESVDKQSARAAAKKWWETEGQHLAASSGAAREQMDPQEFEKVRNYAIQEAGKARIPLA
ncbi:MAG TPA: hypothetical protein PKC24_06030 [Cyclobacteriaceae bacterium]|nr:hypothetical protein [Cyclobacteriaceae bacterium]